eukprot:4829561-Prymnesium_polylepis.1
MRERAKRDRQHGHSEARLRFRVRVPVGGGEAPVSDTFCGGISMKVRARVRVKGSSASSAVGPARPSHLLRRDLDAEVAARHHHAVRHLQDLVEVAHPLVVLDLRDDLHALAHLGVGGDEARAHVDHILLFAARRGRRRRRPWAPAHAGDRRAPRVRTCSMRPPRFQRKVWERGLLRGAHIRPLRAPATWRRGGGATPHRMNEAKTISTFWPTPQARSF